MQAFYTFVIYPILHFGFWVASFFIPKVKEGFKLRKQKWSTGLSGPWVWFHVASGELEYAKPVIKALKSRPDFKSKILVTFFSPSVFESLKKFTEVDFFLPMPWDTPWHWRRFLRTYKPQVLAIARTDVWPNMVFESAKANVPSLLFSATLPSQSGRVASFWGRLFYSFIFGGLTHVSAVAEEDAENFQRISSAISTSIDGDTRFDQVISRVDEKRALPLWTEQVQFSLVAGSTWPEDERVIVPALAQHIQNSKSLVIIAPHEPTPSHLEPLEKAFKDRNIKAERFSLVSRPPESGVILVDRVGVLADLYRLSPLAFVGGSFRKTVHSVMEPAASGCATFFGPFYRNNREAIALRNQKLAFEIQRSEDLTKALHGYFSRSSAEKTHLRDKIVSFVQKNKGVSQKTAQWIVEHIKT